MKKQYLLLAVFLLFFVLPAPAQWVLSPADSSTFENAKNDEQLLRQLINAHQGDRLGAAAQIQIGRIAYDNGRFDDAEQEFMVTYRQYINTPEAQAAMYELGRVKFKKYQFPEAETYIKEYLKTKPTGRDAERAKFLYIQTMEETKDAAYADSIRSYLATPHTSTMAKDPLVHYGLVRYYGRTGNIAKALEEAKSLIQKYPKTKYANFAESRIVDCYCIMGKPEEAVEFCQSLLKKYPSNSEEAARAHRMLGSIRMNTTQYGLSRSEYQEQIKQGTPGSPRVMKAEYALAIVDVREGRAKNDTMLLATAMKKLKIFVKKYSEDPWSSRAWMDIADLSIAKQDIPSALDAYDRIIAFDTAYIAGRKISRHSNMYLEELDRIKQAHLSKGITLRTQMKNPKDAMSEFDNILTGNPNNTSASLNKALCLVDLGRKVEAKTILQQLVQNGTNVKGAAAQILKKLDDKKGGKK
ncbi:MAG: tetratricopeptide repeat protein [Bacteroidota bacterium]